MYKPIDWALELYDLGYTPIPMAPASKRPAIPWKIYQHERPKRDAVQSWFTDDPNRNIALVTGKASGLVVVDADSDEAMDHVENTTDETPVRIVTRRGCHYWFQHPGPSVTSGRALDEPPVDVKGDGGLAMAPGSVHETGHLYILGHGCDLVSIHDLPFYNPDWFPPPVNLGWTPPPPPDFKTMPRSKLDRIERAEAYLAKIPGVGSGLRNSQAFKAASSAFRDFGLAFEESWQLFASWNLRNDPPLPEDELKDILRSALSNGRKPLGWRVA